MKKYLPIIALFAGAALVFYALSPSHAQDTAPATHVWVYSNTATVYVPASTKEGCKTLVGQASMLNSSTGHCYYRDQFLEEIKCSKSLQAGGAPSCTTSASSTR
jgi:N6-adenosine-specific RNA methylase IME4